MCGFLISPLPNPAVDERIRLRGPDRTRFFEYCGYTVYHCLLDVNQCAIEQPLDLGDKVVVFNGQIYSISAFEGPEGAEIHPHRGDDAALLADVFRPLSTDAEIREGFDRINGEFSIAIICEDGRLFIGKDTFGTKPLAYGLTDDGRAVAASYREAIATLVKGAVALIGLQEVDAGELVRIRDGEISQESIGFSFDFASAGTGAYEEWLSAFQNSLKIRALTRGRLPFVPMSSGLDSGLIVAEMLNMGLDFCTFVAPYAEDELVLDARLDVLRNNGVAVEIVEPSKTEVQDIVSHLELLFPSHRVALDNGEPENYPDPKLTSISGLIALGAIFRRARTLGLLTQITGQGADEIYTDYSSGSMRMSSLKADWSRSTQEWPNFRNGWQAVFLQTSERIAGAFSIESRYPFLEANSAQAFLRLSLDDRYRRLKEPIIRRLEDLGFPFHEVKQGFVGFDSRIVEEN
jgi:asparagine synthetase B (glutamine-hydrolysing)